MKSADVPEVMNGRLSLGIQYQGTEAASIDVTWTREPFTARFSGFAPEMPVPAHPLAFAKGAMDALNAAKAVPDKALGSLLPDDLTFFLYRTGAEAEAFRAANPGVLEQVGRYNKAHLTAFTYLGAKVDPQPSN